MVMVRVMVKVCIRIRIRVRVRVRIRIRIRVRIRYTKRPHLLHIVIRSIDTLKSPQRDGAVLLIVWVSEEPAF